MSELTDQQPPSPLSEPVTPHATNGIRKEIFKMLIDLDMFLVSGSMACLAKAISAHYGRKISRQMISMALTGYRSGESSQSLLEDIKQYLDEQKMTASHLMGDDIHMQNPHVNENMAASNAN